MARYIIDCGHSEIIAFCRLLWLCAVVALDETNNRTDYSRTGRERTVQQKIDRSGPVLFSRDRPAIQYQSSTEGPASDIAVSVIELGYM